MPNNIKTQFTFPNLPEILDMPDEDDDDDL